MEGLTAGFAAGLLEGVTAGLLEGLLVALTAGDFAGFAEGVTGASTAAAGFAFLLVVAMTYSK